MPLVRLGVRGPHHEPHRRVDCGGWSERHQLVRRRHGDSGPHAGGAQFFERYRAASPPTPKPSECILVPLAERSDWTTTSQRYKEIVQAMVLSWASFEVAPSAVYLGALLGPEVRPEDRLLGFGT